MQNDNKKYLKNLTDYKKKVLLMPVTLIMDIIMVKIMFDDIFYIKKVTDN